ncbi:MAG: hypothetical protein ABR511_08425 [Acidimicrobiales bacterium]
MTAPSASEPGRRPPPAVDVEQARQAIVAAVRRAVGARVDRAASTSSIRAGGFVGARSGGAAEVDLGARRSP